MCDDYVHPRGFVYNVQAVWMSWMAYYRQHESTLRSYGIKIEHFWIYDWPSTIVMDERTDKEYIATKRWYIKDFIASTKFMYGVETDFPLRSARVYHQETQKRALHRFYDHASFKKLQSTIPGTPSEPDPKSLPLDVRIRDGDPELIEKTWDQKNKTYLVLDFKWSDISWGSRAPWPPVLLEFGYACVRCGHLAEQYKIWPFDDDPALNYRRAHYVVAENINLGVNRYSPVRPWEYAFGNTQVISRMQVKEIIENLLKELAAVDDRGLYNRLVIVGHNMKGVLDSLKNLNINLPEKILTISTTLYERQLFLSGSRNPTSGRLSHRLPNTTLNLTLNFSKFIQSFPPPGDYISKNPPSGYKRLTSLPGCALGNSGNDAFLTLYAFQKLVEPSGTPMPAVKELVYKPPAESITSAKRKKREARKGAGTVDKEVVVEYVVSAFDVCL